MKHTHRFEISGAHYEIMHFTPTKSIPLMVRIGKILGQPLAALFGADDNMTVESVLPVVVGALTDRLDEQMVLNTIKELFEGATAKDDKGQYQHFEFDLQFMGRLGHMMKVVREILKFQYADFLEGAGVKGLVRQLTPKAQA